MSELGPEEQRWLEVLRTADAPSDADRERVRSAVLASVVGGAGLTAGAALGKAASVGWVANAWKIGVGVLSLMMAGTTTTWLVHRHAGSRAYPRAELVSRVSLQEPAPGAEPQRPSATPESAEPSVHGPSSAPTTSARADAVAGRATPKRTAESLDAELALLTEAQRSLKQGNAREALRILAQHRREHPRGVLQVERDGLHAVASCEAKHASGRSLAERFLARNPSSPLASRVRAACLSP